MRYFVTGATGFIGGYVVRQLVERGDRVVAAVRDRGKAAHLESQGVEVVEADVTEKESLRPGMRGADGVFHIAGWYRLGVRDADTAHAVNVEGTRNVIELAEELAVPRIVYTSTLAVHSDTRGAHVDESYKYAGPFLSLYEKTKWQAHYEVALPLAARGVPVITVMPGLVYGPGDPSAFGQAMRDFLSGRLPFVPTGTGFCLGHVADTTAAHLAAMGRGRPGEMYHIAGPAHTLIEAFAVAAEAAGRRRPRRIPSVMIKALALASQGVEQLRTLPPAYSSEGLRATAGVTYWGTSRKAERELGIRMRPLRAGLSETVRWELSRHRGGA